ncbi:MAG: fibronectin type III domain-containing protein [Chloroflexi bacterium]|nr:fibronectin type III domain-containing protein [Chloroflexota bacterium]
MRWIRAVGAVLMSVVLTLGSTSCAKKDASPPVVSDVVVSGIGKTTATIEWTTDEAAASQVDYGTTTAYGISSTLDDNLVTNHGVALVDLAAGTTYHFRVRAIDATGNESASPDASFSTDLDWPFLGSIDIAEATAGEALTWLVQGVTQFSRTYSMPEVSFTMTDAPLKNRRNGQISPTLLAGYFFLQWDISSTDFEKYANTINALFIRSALMSFVDYANNRVFLPWSRQSTQIPTDVAGIIRVCNDQHIPVFVQVNDSDFIPGPTGTGLESLQPSNNIANTLAFLRTLKSNSLSVTGITFGDEIEDNNDTNSTGYGPYRPNLYNSDYVGRFISYAKAIKSEFPELKIYAFDSYIAATRGRVSLYWDCLERIREAEIQEGRALLDGFSFGESYVYMDDQGNVMDSQSILDDTESLYRDTPVYRYDFDGTRHPDPDAGYLPLLVSKTREIFGRDIDIGIREYLPAGAFWISEIDTSRYSDMDFIIHFSDMVGIYAELGLDYISKIMFGDSVNQHKAYFDRQGNLGPNFPVHKQLAERFSGEILEVGRTVPYDDLKVKVYGTHKGDSYFVMILNKDVDRGHTIQVTLDDRFDLTLRLPKRSYTSLTVSSEGIEVSTIQG